METKEINGDLILTEEFEFLGNLIVQGDIYGKDDMRYNIHAYDITANDIHAYDLNAYNIYANDITANDIDANDIDANDIHAYDLNVYNVYANDITANDIDANHIVCETVKSKKRIFARSLLKNRSSIIRKDFNKK